MKFFDIYNNTSKPNLYEKGNAIMWTDEHISKQLLHVHLNANLDLGSRRTSTITSTVDWLLSDTEQKSLSILDLGCGPGLYSELLAKKGHRVTGVDFSSNSIAYAKQESKNKKLGIKYLEADYLNLDLPQNTFDLVLLIFTDFGPLLPIERKKLLSTIKKVLKPDGMFIFDVLNDKNIESKSIPKNWESLPEGFWKNEPYLVLSNSFTYHESKVILYQHMVIDEQENLSIYRFWTHFFSHSDLRNILSEHQFSKLSFHEDVLPEGDLWNGDNVTFCKAINSK